VYTKPSVGAEAVPSAVGVGTNASETGGVDNNIGGDTDGVRGGKKIVAITSIEFRFGEDLAHIRCEMRTGSEIPGGK
jgi:hypothetical protein